MKPLTRSVLVLMIFLTGCATGGPRVANVHVVTPSLVRGGQPNAAALKSLKETYGIQTVVNLNGSTATSEAISAGALDLNYVPIPSDPFNPQRDQLLTFLTLATDPRSGPVYVHCQHGMDRTGVAVAVYRMIVQDWTRQSALDELRKYQSLSHELVFPEIPQFLSEVDRARPQWKTLLAARQSAGK